MIRVLEDDLRVDPGLLLFLSAPSCLIERQDWLKKLKALHFELCMIPFHARLVSSLGESGSDALTASLMEYCTEHHLEFLREDTASVDHINNAIESHLLSAPPTAWISARKSQEEDNSDFRTFFRTIHAHLSHMKQIAPTRFVAALKKDYAREEYQKKREQWGIHKPFFIQTYDTSPTTGVAKGSSVFYIFATAPDGLNRLLDMLSLGATSFNGKVYRVMGAYEHVLDEETLCYPILDWEVMQNFFGGRCSGRDIMWIMKEFPEILLRHWHQHDILGHGGALVQYKHKSRATASGFKMSMHFILGVLGERRHHNASLHHFVETPCRDGTCFRHWIDFAKLQSSENGGRLPESFPSIPGSDHDFLIDPYTSVYPFDYKAGKGNGFSMAFSRKSDSDPFSVYWGKTDYVRGLTSFADDLNKNDPELTQFPCQFPPPHDLTGTHLSAQDRLLLLHEQCYTTAKFRSGHYTERFLASVKSAQEKQARSNLY